MKNEKSLKLLTTIKKIKKKQCTYKLKIKIFGSNRPFQANKEFYNLIYSNLKDNDIY